MRKLFKFFSLFGLIVAIGIFGLIFVGEKTFPDTIFLIENQTLQNRGIYALYEAEGLLDTQLANAERDRSLSKQESTYQVDISLLHSIPVKSSTVKVSKRQYVIPGGDVFGMKLHTDGILIVGMDDVPTEDGIVNPAKQAGLKTGDVILCVNASPINRVSDLSRVIQSESTSVTLTVRRGEKEWHTTLELAISANDGKPKAGLWVRDSTAGVGTITFICKENGLFGGLGHAICDVDTGAQMPMADGEAVKTHISGCYKGSAGVAGELCGVFQEETIGTLYENCSSGIYGQLKSVSEQEEIPVATKSEVKVGSAQIIATVDGEGPKRYAAEILKIYPNSDENGKNLVVQITDETLIEKTGGIVQGMSGSPILQNGMLVGAVTHVFVNNALQGYGIFAETMLADALQSQTQALQAAS